MGLERLLNDVFERIDYLNENVQNPFLNKDNQTNPFAKFFNRTYIWIDNPNTKE